MIIVKKSRYLIFKNLKFRCSVGKGGIKNKVKEYKNKTNYYKTISKEKKKEYAKRAYLNKKAKLNKTNEIKENGRQASSCILI